MTYDIVKLTPLLGMPDEDPGWGAAECVEAEFDDKADAADISVALASGALAAAVDILWVGEFSLERAQDWGREKTSDFVVAVAKMTGCKGDTLEEAIRHLERGFELASDKLTAEFGGGPQHHLRDFSHHPTVAGLAFSLLSQFLGLGYGTDAAGNFVVFDLPAGALVGKDPVEKVFFGTAIWALHLVSDMAGSNANPGRGTGIPGVVLSLLKELSSLPFFKAAENERGDQQEGFRFLVSKLFDGTALPYEDYRERLQFDLRMEVGVAHELARQAVPVVVNEGVTRLAYALRRLVRLLKRARPSGFSELLALDFKAALAADGRALTRMLTVSSGTLFALEAAAAAVQAAMASKRNGASFFKEFAVRVNIVGAGRFVFACRADARYIAQDMREMYGRFAARHCRVDDWSRAALEGMDALFLSPAQQVLVESLVLQKALADLAATKDADARRRKEAALACRPLADGCLVRDADELYALMERETKLHGADWLLAAALMVQDADPWGVVVDERPTLEKEGRGYVKDVLCARQRSLGKKRFEGLLAKRMSYRFSVKGGKLKRALVGGAFVVGGAVAGGAAVIVAPALAVTIAGGSFAGLSGIALTNASLAALGGGSLAAGGLGMAGGTFVLGVGGAVAGAVGTGAVAATGGRPAAHERFGGRFLLTFAHHRRRGRRAEERLRESHRRHARPPRHLRQALQGARRGARP